MNASYASYAIDPDGEFVDFLIPESTGLAQPQTLTVPTDELGRIYVTARAAQLGADTKGDL